ncbi:MAG: hypothetical protein K6E68_01685, partial [Lachnospiraceae bacterium]|nr:hypothetical protein [Lachnospiraceae bacterium]
FTIFEGFGYGGVYNIVYSIMIFVLFTSLPISLFHPVIRKILRFASKYSMGVFCAHFAVGKILNILLLYFDIKIEPFLKCLVIFLICLFVSSVLSIIPTRFTKQLVE